MLGKYPLRNKSCENNNTIVLEKIGTKISWSAKPQKQI